MDSSDRGLDKAERAKLKAYRMGQALDPGTIIRTRSGRVDYVIGEDGSRRAIPAGSGNGPELWAPKLAARQDVKALNAGPAEPGIAEKILRARNSQEAAAILLRAQKELTGASAATRRRWRKALEGVQARELHERLHPTPRKISLVA